MTRDWKEDSMSHVDEGALHAYLDGELSSTERSTVDAHLAQCATCRATLAEERALLERASALLGSARPVERPAPPFEQIRRSPKRSPWRLRTPFAWAASIMVALGLGYYLRDLGNGASFRMAPPQPVGIAEDRLAHVSDSAPVRQKSPTARRPESERIRRVEPRADGLARADVQARADSPAAGPPPAAAAGEVALKSRLEPARALLRDSSVRLEAVVVSGVGSAARLREEAGRTAQWQSISRGNARTLLGTDPVGLPGLATRRIRRSPAPDATVVVEQALDSATVIQIFQRPAETVGLDASARQQRERAPAAAPREMAPADRLARFVGRLRVEISGPLSTDSLNQLLELVEPLP
jgi:hypothetical protein